MRYRTDTMRAKFRCVIPAYVRYACLASRQCYVPTTRIFVSNFRCVIPLRALGTCFGLSAALRPAYVSNFFTLDDACVSCQGTILIHFACLCVIGWV